MATLKANLNHSFVNNSASSSNSSNRNMSRAGGGKDDDFESAHVTSVAMANVLFARGSFFKDLMGFWSKDGIRKETEKWGEQIDRL